MLKSFLIVHEGERLISAHGHQLYNVLFMFVSGYTNLFLVFFTPLVEFPEIANNYKYGKLKTL